jgi:predicted transcriptional regulator
MTKRIKVNVGSVEDMGQRFVKAWHRLDAGEKIQESHLTFPSLPAMLNALSPKRLELLRAVHGNTARSVRALAVRLGRDYKRVHQDVETLTAPGLLRRDNGGVSAPYDAITAEMRLNSPLRLPTSRFVPAAKRPLPRELSGTKALYRRG